MVESRVISPSASAETKTRNVAAFGADENVSPSLFVAPKLLSPIPAEGSASAASRRRLLGKTNASDYIFGNATIVAEGGGRGGPLMY